MIRIDYDLLKGIFVINGLSYLATIFLYMLIDLVINENKLKEFVIFMGIFILFWSIMLFIILNNSDRIKKRYTINKWC